MAGHWYMTLLDAKLKTAVAPSTAANVDFVDSAAFPSRC
jgi:hypothetical protein